MEIVMYEIKIIKISETRRQYNGYPIVMFDPSDGWTERFYPIVIFGKFLKRLGWIGWSSYPYMFTEKVFKNERSAIYRYNSLPKSMKSDKRYHVKLVSYSPCIISDFEISVKEVNDNA